MIRDLTIAIRMLRRTPGVTAAALVCLACGIGVTVTIFSALSSIFLKPLPFPDAHNLVVVHAQPIQPSAASARTVPLSWEEFTAWRDGARTMTGLAVWIPRAHELSGPERDNERAAGAVISPDLFEVLGLRAMRGVATFDRPRGQVLLSHGIWQRRYGADPAIVGRSVTVFRSPHVVVGIMPPGTVFPEGTEVWTALNAEEEKAVVRRYPGALGRLATGATATLMQGELARIAQQSGTNRDSTGPVVVSLREDLVGSLRRPIVMFQSAAVLVLLIACANVANLMLARGTTQLRDMAVRLALGAGHRVMRSVLAESLVLSLTGGALGTIMAFYGIRLLGLAFPDGVPSYIHLAIDPFVLGVSLAVAIGTGLLFGLAPALRARSVDPSAILAVGGRTVQGPGAGGRLRDVVVAAEFALSLVVMIGATLLIRSDAALEREVAFDAEHILSVRVPLPYPTYEGPRRDRFFEELFARIRALPGVQAVGSATPGAPMGPEVLLRRSFVPGSVRGEADSPTAVVRDVSPHYLRALGVPLFRGREFTPEERHDAVPPAIINEILARENFSGVDPIGRYVTTWDPAAGPKGTTQTFAIVGIAANFREERPTGPLGPTIYMGRPAFPGGQTLAIRTTLDDPLTLVPSVRAIVKTLDPNLFMYMVNRLDRTVAGGLWRQRLQARVLGIFATVAFVLAIFGIYSVISYTAAQRTHELAMRAALGATRANLVSLITRQGMVPIAFGLTLGVLSALWLTPTLAGLLYDVEATDARTFLAVPVVLAIAALVGMILPALRAARVDPIVAMRE